MGTKWLDNFGKAENANEGTSRGPGALDYTTKGFNYNGAWGGQFKSGGWLDQYQSGGSLAGSVGFTYARTQGIPSNGKYAKKTLPSAQDGIKIKDPKLRAEVARNNARLAAMSKASESRNIARKKEEAKKWVGKSMQEAYKHPLMQPGIVTPEGALIASMQSGVQSAQDISEGNYGQAAMHAGFAALPFAGKIPGVQRLASRLNPRATNQLAEIPSELNIDVDAPFGGIDLRGARNVSRNQKVPQWEYKELESGLTESIPVRKGVGNDDVIRKVSAPNKGDISLKTYNDEAGNPLYYFSANMPGGGLTAGKAFKHLEQYVPKGGKILEKESLSTDSFHNILQRAKNPEKFTWSHEGYVPLNSAGRNKVISNVDEAVGGLNTQFRSAEEAEKALAEINSRIKIEGMPKARITKKIDQAKFAETGPNAPIPRLYQIEVPNIGLTKMYRPGGIIQDNNGYWNPDNWGNPVEIDGNDITMQGVYKPLLGISDTGDMKLMQPGKNYKFKGKKVTELPVGKNGEKLRQEQKSAINLDNLTNFTNYNTPQPGGWLDNL